MTWYASHIYGRDTPELRAALLAHPVFRRGLYCLEGPIEREWHSPAHRHAFPEGGLLVVRELCERTDDEEDDYVSGWYGDDALLIDELSDRPPPAVTAATVAASTEIEDGYLPSSNLLSEVAALSSELVVPLAYYSHAMWGGETESEFSWFFDSTPLVYAYKDAERHVIVDARGETEVAPESVLTKVMSHFGLDLPSGYFAPHTRGFPWANFKI